MNERHLSFHTYRQMMKRTISLALAAIATLVLASQASYAQRPGGGDENQRRSPFQLGLHVGGGLILPSAEFATLPGVLSCQGDSVLYSGESGNGFSVAAVVGMQPMPGAGFASHIGWVGRIGLATSGTSFEAEERIGQSISPTGELADVRSRYDLTTSLTSLVIEPALLYQVGADIPLIVSVGPTFGVQMAASFDQKEEIAAPADATFSDGRTTRNQRDGDIEETSGFGLGAAIGLAYDIRISPTISVRPQVDFGLGFTGPVSDVDWKQNEIRAGISILFNPIAVTSSPLGE